MILRTILCFPQNLDYFSRQIPIHLIIIAEYFIIRHHQILTHFILTFTLMIPDFFLSLDTFDFIRSRGFFAF